MVRVVPRSRQQPGGARVIELLPPEVEEQHAVREARLHLLDGCLEGSGLLILGVLGEPEVGVRAEPAHRPGDRLGQFQRVQKRLWGNLRGQPVPKSFKAPDLLLELLPENVQIVGWIAQQVLQVPDFCGARIRGQSRFSHEKPFFWARHPKSTLTPFRTPDRNSRRPATPRGAPARNRHRQDAAPPGNTDRTGTPN